MVLVLLGATFHKSLLVVIPLYFLASLSWARQTVDQFDQKIKSDLRRHISIAVDQMHELHILCVVIAHIESARGEQGAAAFPAVFVGAQENHVPENFGRQGVSHDASGRAGGARQMILYITIAVVTALLASLVDNHPERQSHTITRTEIFRHMVFLCTHKNRRESGSASFP